MSLYRLSYSRHITSVFIITRKNQPVAKCVSEVTCGKVPRLAKLVVSRLIKGKVKGEREIDGDMAS